MSRTSSAERFNTIQARKKFGSRYRYGIACFGGSQYGDQGLFGWIYGYGLSLYGVCELGVDDELTGIYQIRHSAGAQIIVRTIFTWPKNKKTIPQQANRAKFADAITAWQGLTEEQKKIYNTNSSGKQMSGYNLFIRQYLQSH